MAFRFGALLGNESAVFPQVASSSRHLVDGNNGNAPWLMNSVASWSMLAQLNQAETQTFLNNCVTYGINCIRCNLVEAHFSNATQGTGTNAFGNTPWTGTKFASSLRTAYWNHVEWALDQCATRGIAMIAFPAYPGINGGAEGWWGEGMKSAGAANLQTYGSNVGSVLKNHPNVITAIGGDYWVGDDTSPSGATNLAIQNAMVTGLRSTDRSGRVYMGHWGPGSDSIDHAETWLSLNHEYDQFTSITARTKTAYNNSPTRPTFYGEGNYKRRQAVNPSDKDLRAQYWPALCWGSCGLENGDEAVWDFDSPNGFSSEDWADHLADAYWTHQKQVRDVMGSRAWHLTTPDYSHAVVTSGYGTEDDTDFCPVRSSSSLLLAYCPQGATLTIVQSGFSANIDIKKIDPTNGAVTVVASNVSPSGSAARAFTGTNAGGDSDWIAVVELH